MLSAGPVAHEGEAISRKIGIEALPAFLPPASREILHGSSELLRALGVEAVGDDVARGGGTLGGAEEADFVEQFGGAVGVEEGESLGVGVGLEQGLADLGGDDEAVLLDAGDAGDLLDGRRGEAELVEGRDDGGVVEPEAEALGEDLEAAGGVEGVQFRRGGRPEGLVELLLLLLLL